MVLPDEVPVCSPPSRLNIVCVTFEPGVRTAWHTHPVSHCPNAYPIVLAEYGPRTTGNQSARNTSTNDSISQASCLGRAGASIRDYDPTGQGNLTIVSGVGPNGNTGDWHNCCYTLQYYSVHQFGL